MLPVTILTGHLRKDKSFREKESGPVKRHLRRKAACRAEAHLPVRSEISGILSAFCLRLFFLFWVYFVRENTFSIEQTANAPLFRLSG
jgi:hypothetical protein